MNAEVLGALAQVMDPELGVSIVDLGLVYGTERTDDAILVVMTTTVPSCPASDVLVADARAALAREFPAVASIRVELVFDPVWTPARMSEAAREQLGWPTKSRRSRWTDRIAQALTRH